MLTSQEEIEKQDMVEIPIEYFKLNEIRKGLIDDVIRRLYESQQKDT